MGLKPIFITIFLVFLSLHASDDFYSTKATLNQNGLVEIDNLSYSFHDLVLSAQKAHFALDIKDRLYGENIDLKGLDFSLRSPTCLIDRHFEKIICSQTKDHPLTCDIFTDFGLLSGSMEGASIYKENGLIHMELIGPLDLHSDQSLFQFNAGSALFCWNASKKLSTISLFSEKIASPLSCYLQFNTDTLLIKADRVDCDLTAQSLDLSHHVYLKLVRTLNQEKSDCTISHSAESPSPAQLPHKKIAFSGSVQSKGSTELELCLPDHPPLFVKSSDGFCLSKNQFYSIASPHHPLSLDHADLSILADQIFCFFDEQACTILLEGGVKAVTKIGDHFYGMICDSLFYDPLSSRIELYSRQGSDVLLWDQQDNMALRLSSIVIEENKIACKGAVNLYIKEGQFHEVFDQFKSMREWNLHVISR